MSVLILLIAFPLLIGVILTVGVITFFFPKVMAIVLGVVTSTSLLMLLVFGSTRVVTHTVVSPPRQAAIQVETLPRYEATQDMDHETVTTPVSRPAAVASETETVPTPTALRLPNEPIAITETVIDSPDHRFRREGLAQLPDWVTQESLVEENGEEIEMFLTSQRFATAQEAREQIWPVVLHHLLDQLKAEQFEIAATELTISQAMSWGLIQREVDATYPLEVGDDSLEVHQVHWNVKLNPQTRQRVIANWRPMIAQHRLWSLAAIMGGATLLMGAGSVVSRRTHIRNGAAAKS